jgi:hypothetical protein
VSQRERGRERERWREREREREREMEREILPDLEQLLNRCMRLLRRSGSIRENS